MHFDTSFDTRSLEVATRFADEATARVFAPTSGRRTVGPNQARATLVDSAAGSPVSARATLAAAGRQAVAVVRCEASVAAAIFPTRHGHRVRTAVPVA
jgi:hypothetical protein